MLDSYFFNKSKNKRRDTAEYESGHSRRQSATTVCRDMRAICYKNSDFEFCTSNWRRTFILLCITIYYRIYSFNNPTRIIIRLE